MGCMNMKSGRISNKFVMSHILSSQILRFMIGDVVVYHDTHISKFLSSLLNGKNLICCQTKHFLFCHIKRAVRT